MKKLLTGSLAAIALAVSVQAAAQVDPEDQIYYRKAGYAFMAWNVGKIKGMLENESTWNLEQVQAAANSIAATANSGMGALFSPGTEKSIGDTKTRVKPEMFQDAEGVNKVGMAFHKAATELKVAADAGDKVQITTAFSDLGASCKGCHDNYRMK